MSTATAEAQEQETPVGPEPVEPVEPVAPTPESAPEPEPEPEPEPAKVEPGTPPVGLSERDAEQRFNRLEKRAETWRNAVRDVLGELATDLEPCPRCLPMAPGFIYPFAAVPISPEQIGAVKLSIGELAEPTYKQADDAFTCPKCDGEGKVATGSKKPNEKTGKCLECDGRGWVGARLHVIKQLPAEQQAALAAETETPAPTTPETDNWGRPQGHPGFMVMPYEGMPEEQKPPGWA